MHNGFQIKKTLFSEQNRIYEGIFYDYHFLFQKWELKLIVELRVHSSKAIIIYLHSIRKVAVIFQENNSLFVQFCIDRSI